MRIFFIIAFRNVLQRKTRSLMLFSAIAVVAFIFSMMLSLVQGIKNTMISNGTALMTGHINIAGFHKISQSSANPSVVNFYPLMDYAKKEIPEAKIILDRVKMYGKIISETDSVMIPMWGVNMEQEADVLGKLELEKLSEKSQPGNLEELKNQGTIALFAVHAKKLKVDVGDMVTASIPTYRNINNTKDLKVVAVLKDVGMMSQFNGYMNAKDSREIYQSKEDTTGQIMIYLKNLGDLEKVETRIRKDLSDRNYILMDKDPNPFWMKFDRVAGESWTGQKIDVTTWEDETSFLKWIISLLSALTFILTIILSIIIVMGLINALWMSVKERTTEIGTLRAIGMQRFQVLWMILFEALIISVSATIAGLSLTLILSSFLNLLKISITSDSFQLIFMSNHLNFSFGIQEAFFAFISLVIFFTLGSLLPSRQAAKLSPIVAINQN